MVPQAQPPRARHPRWARPPKGAPSWCVDGPVPRRTGSSNRSIDPAETRATTRSAGQRPGWRGAWHRPCKDCPQTMSGVEASGSKLRQESQGSGRSADRRWSESGPARSGRPDYTAGQKPGRAIPLSSFVHLPGDFHVAHRRFTPLFHCLSWGQPRCPAFFRLRVRRRHGQDRNRGVDRLRPVLHRGPARPLQEIRRQGLHADVPGPGADPAGNHRRYRRRRPHHVRPGDQLGRQGLHHEGRDADRPLQRRRCDRGDGRGQEVPRHLFVEGRTRHDHRRARVQG